jgi:hypothetical protein
MPKMLLTVTGYQADAMFAAQNTHSLIEFDTDDLVHGSDDQVLTRIENVVESFVALQEVDGLHFNAQVYKHMAQITQVIANVHEGDPDVVPFRYSPVYIDESCYKTNLWVGPAE